MKLTEKDINAFAVKLQAKDKAIRDAALKEQTKKMLPKARELHAQLSKVPQRVANEVFSYSFKNKNSIIETIADKLVDPSALPEVKELAVYAADVSIAAIEASNLTALCKKLAL